MTVSDTGTYYIDALLLNQSWSGFASKSATITYGYGQPSGSTARELKSETSVFDVSDSLERAVKTVERTWATYANVSFKLVPPSSIFTADKPLMIAQTDEGLNDDFAGVTYIYDTEATLSKADIIVGEDYAGAAMAPGNYGYFALLHEFGHALGLKHSFEGDSSLSGVEDSWDYTIMSYTEGQFLNMSQLPTTPMLYDIAAIQYLYGANYSTYSGDNYHTITDGQAASVIWDGGGNDTIDASQYAGNATLDLQEGLSHMNLVGNTAVWMAFGANIEGAIAGGGSDSINGNNLNNQLYGGGGNDTMVGLEGADFLQGNQGIDNLSGGGGNDTLYGGKDSDAIRGGKGNDVINSNMGDDTVQGDLGNDTIQGGQGNDLLSGQDGSDVILGDKGNDTIQGGSGADVFRFEQLDAATDIIEDFETAGLLDRLQFSQALFTSADAVLASSSYSAGTQTILLAGGGTVILQNLTTSLTIDDILIG